MADRRSRVPQRTYATTLDEQLEQLETDPLLQRFHASRKRLSSDPHRPVYHYVNPEGNLNDPNGFCYWDGRYHLFFQAYPPKISASTGGTPAAMTSCTGATCRWPSTPTRRTSDSAAPPWSRRTASSPATTASTRVP